MGRRHAVILTYPAHFLLTKLCIDYLQKTQPDIGEITVIVDDISVLSWPSYVQDCRELYRHRIVATSQFPEFQLLRRWPWVRQQVIKLSLDKLVTADRVFFCDGDVLLYQPVPEYATPFTITQYLGVPLSERDPGPGETTSQQSYYVEHLLGIPHLGVQHNNQRVCVSHPPFRDIILQDITDLRQFIENRFGRNIISVHRDLVNNTKHSVSEWELLCWYQQTMLGRTLELIHWPTQPLEAPITEHSRAATCWQSDREIGHDWWQQQAIDFERYWAILPENKYSTISA